MPPLDSMKTHVADSVMLRSVLTIFAGSSRHLCRSISIIARRSVNPHDSLDHAMQNTLVLPCSKWQHLPRDIKRRQNLQPVLSAFIILT
ncbi:uncharacterized protein LAESUDRAFT_449452 [Laetiporus sulphureus 93-53]|uniref:Uncharacterized protein n=1 Tax=Laetiporus sulphureus 93-53 TaxID=1314785 RepID=A0A165BZ72_9APHY|nr:uncharacterized protein LAESUDRAFT_449452 [Laetiporus sulphureus 93-53]KZT01916.1 hypothetical protein LAESUDRAFT_449452 [Laetiporus sulphureus 93-53]